MTLHDNDCEGSTEDCCCAYRKEISTLTRSKEDAWKNNHILEAARQEEMKKRGAAEAVLTMLKNDVEELRESLNEELFLRMDALTKLAISQAREEKLREGLTEVRKDLVQRAEMDQDDGGAILNISNGVLRRMDEALAMLFDDSTLRDRLAQERERCALCVEAYSMDWVACARAIRSMK